MMMMMMMVSGNKPIYICNVTIDMVRTILVVCAVVQISFIVGRIEAALALRYGMYGGRE